MKQCQTEKYNERILPNESIVVFHDLDRTPEGSVVESWPLHCTLVAPFSPNSATALSGIVRSLHDDFNSFRILEAHRGPITHFDLDEDLEVSLIGSFGVTNYDELVRNDALKLLHRRLLLGLDVVAKVISLDCSFNSYTPHVTHLGNRRPPGNFSVDTLSVGIRRADNTKQIAAVIRRG